MQKYMGIESTDVHDLFDAEARRFRNLFTNAFPTKNSFNTLLSLDANVFMEYKRTSRKAEIRDSSLANGPAR